MLPLRHMRKTFLIAAVGFFAWNGVAFGQQPWPPGSGQPPSGGGGTPFTITLPNPLACTSTTPGSSQVFCILDKILTVLFNLSIPITTIMVLVGGFQILTAAGDPEKFKTGRKTILYAVVGFAVVFLANSIVPIIQDFLR